MKGIITAAGYASRLWPLTKDTPKPLLEVKGKPIVEHIVHKLSELKDIDGIFIITNAKFYPVFTTWLESCSFTIPVKIINDGTTSNDDRLGQIGDIQFALEKENITDDVLITAGDNLFNFSLQPVYEEFKKHKGIVNPLYDIRSVDAARELGTVLLDDSNYFAEFHEKHPHPQTTLVSLGIYFFPKDKLSIIKQYLAEKSNPDKMGYFLNWMMKKEKVKGHVHTERWFDIGWIESLEAARKDFVPLTGRNS